MELDEVLVLTFAASPGRIAALELVADLDRPVARQQQGQGLGPGETPAQVAKPKSRRLSALARDLSKADQIAAFDRDVAADVAPEQVVERRPPQQRAQHAGPRDPDARAARSGPTERDGRAVPQPERKGSIDRLREMLEDVARSLDLSLRQAAFPQGAARGGGGCAPGRRGTQPRRAAVRRGSRRQACPVAARYSMLCARRGHRSDRARGESTSWLLICRATRKR